MTRERSLRGTQWTNGDLVVAGASLERQLRRVAAVAVGESRRGALQHADVVAGLIDALCRLDPAVSRPVEKVTGPKSRKAGAR